MRASKKTSVDPATKAGRYAALHAALETGEMSITDILDAAKQVAEARVAHERQEAPKADKPAGAFDLKRTLSRPPVGPPIDEPWHDQTTAGPADLIRHFCAAAISEHWPELAHYDEQSHMLIMDVAKFAVDVAVRLAGVSENWTDEYRNLTTGLHR